MGRLQKGQIVSWAKGRRRISAPVSIVAIAVAAMTTVALTGAFTGALTAGSSSPGPALTRQQIAQHILSTQAAGVMTAPARTALRMLATDSRSLSPGLPANKVSGGSWTRRAGCLRTILHFVRLYPYKSLLRSRPSCAARGTVLSASVPMFEPGT